MLSDTFQTISKYLINKVEIEGVKLESILEYIQGKPLNSCIHPEIVNDRFDITLGQCMQLFTILEKKNILKQVYKLYCTNCRDFSSDIFENINELEKQNVCKFCGKELYEEENPYKYVVIYFKVANNE